VKSAGVITQEAETEPPQEIRVDSGFDTGRPLIEDLGRIAWFALDIGRRTPGVGRYMVEVFRQAGIVILSSSLVIWFMMLMLAAEISLEGHYLLKQLGASGYTAVFAATGDVAVAPEMWGWIMSAKVGCGLVAELGSMRISEEIDAVDVMGLDSKVYLISTRVVAMLLVTPFMFTVGLGIMYLTNYMLNVHVFKSVSAGGFNDVLWSFTTPADIIATMTAGGIMGMMIVLVGCYYGFTAEGGPVGVGKNTARSMIINLIIVSVVGAIFYQIFFGSLDRMPIGS
jgi:phospholipid/cholesterol/gamma-HCH transport system permease protein